MNAIFGMMILVFGILGYSFFHNLRIYQRVYSSSAALRELGFGYQEAIAYTRNKESEVRKVYFTNHYGQAYIYLLFFKQLTPMEYQHGGLANYTITDRPYADAAGQTNVLVVGTSEEIPITANIVKEITYPDGKVAFRIAKQ